MSFVSAHAQYLRIFEGAITYHRWQSYYANKTVTWDGAAWAHLNFDVSGIVAGDVSAEAGMTVGAPATSITLPAFREALRRGHLVEVLQYEFDPQIDNDNPQPGQRLVASYVGEVVGMNGRFTWIDVELGSALSPVGIQVPPRTMTSQLIGVPCQL